MRSAELVEEAETSGWVDGWMSGWVDSLVWGSAWSSKCVLRLVAFLNPATGLDSPLRGNLRFLIIRPLLAASLDARQTRTAHLSASLTLLAERERQWDGH